ncbi:hypothetical protein [Bdellovibrio sp. HCB-162]|uniref:hypothetical protein n=1 Tax=Bdellovibrio sp. HCB-162 TaxID=3394234 RepID=UPI0039BD8521
MALKHIVLILSLFVGSLSFAAEPCREEPEDLYSYQDQILDLAKNSHSPEELKNKMARPLRCLIEAYKTNDDLLTKYVAGSCIQRLMGGPEIKGFKRTRNYDIVFNSLINQQFESQALLTKSEIAEFASGKWVEYVNFCKGSVTEALCGELLPTNDRIKEQNELLGATSMLVLKSAYHQFSGDTKKHIAAQIVKLYKETSNDSPLKRRVIDQIYREIQEPKVELRGS